MNPAKLTPGEREGLRKALLFAIDSLILTHASGAEARAWAIGVLLVLAEFSPDDEAHAEHALLPEYSERMRRHLLTDAEATMPADAEVPLPAIRELAQRLASVLRSTPPAADSDDPS